MMANAPAGVALDAGDEENGHEHDIKVAAAAESEEQKGLRRRKA
jgi:hypothetical protein